MVFIDLLNNCTKNNNKWATFVVAQQKVGNRLLELSLHHQINSSDPIMERRHRNVHLLRLSAMLRNIAFGGKLLAMKVPPCFPS